MYTKELKMSVDSSLDLHVDNMVKFYESGIKEKSQKLGVELEWTLVHDDMSQVTYFEKFGQKWLMKALRDHFPNDMLDEGGNLIGVENDRDSITLEPAGQFELSAGPFTELVEVEETFAHFFETVNALTKQHGISMIPIGYHPKCKAEELKIIPKVRYELMNEYFLKNSPLGIEMMRGTGSTQVSIDYSSEKDCVRKLRIAYLCTPIFSLLTDNTPTFEGKKRTRHMMRTQVWEDCDPLRCGIVPGLFDDDFGFETYARHVLNTRAMFEMDGDTGHLTGKTTSEVYGEREMDFSACAHASSHLFNDVRLKNFIEIRPADALPTNVAVAYCALVKGLFYSEESLRRAEKLFGEQSEEEIETAKRDLQEKGFEGEAYGQKVAEISSELLSIATDGLTLKDKHYLEPLKKIIENKKTLADEVAPL